MSANKMVEASEANFEWWPLQINLNVLHPQGDRNNPMGLDFNYAEEFKKLDLHAVIKDLHFLMTDSKPWWPADYGHYGPFFIRMAWHAAGTYRIGDGRGGASGAPQRLAPLNSWPDNINLDKARRLLWPIKQKYGQKLSWGDLMILTGNVALESMGLKTCGFGGGRLDFWAPEDDMYWGPEKKWLGNNRYTDMHQLEKPLAATQMGLIYVNPEGPDGNHDPMSSAIDIRQTFARMAMNDYETVALIAGGHAFGKCHGAADPNTHIGPAPEASPIEAQGLGWKNSFKSGHGDATISSGLEGAWTSNPIAWDNNYLENLFDYEWVLTKSPAGAFQWTTEDARAQNTVPDAHHPNVKQTPFMATTDLALKVDPCYEKIARHFLKHPDELADAFAKAWYKLTHRDMGPLSRYLGPLVPKEPMIWQDPLPVITHELVQDKEIEALKTQILSADLTISELVLTAWASASTFRITDKRGGANGARIRLAPQKDWLINEPLKLQLILAKLEVIMDAFNQKQKKKKISLADLIVLGGIAAIEKASHHRIKLPFSPGRSDASQAQTDEHSFAVLKPLADGFRNYVSPNLSCNAPYLLIEKARLLNLSAPEMTALIGGMRVLSANTDNSQHGVLTEKPLTLSNDFFINLLDMNIDWKPKANYYEGHCQLSKQIKWTATSVELIFGSNAQLRAICEVYASDDGLQKFLHDFSNAWSKVMDLDRYDLREPYSSTNVF